MMKIKKKLTAAALAVLMAGAGLPALGNFRILPDMAITVSAANVKVGDSWSIGDTANFGTYWYGSYSLSERSTAENITIPEPVKSTNPLTGAEVWEFPNVFSYDKIAAYGTIQSTPGMPTQYMSLTGSGSLKPTGIRIAGGAGTVENPFKFELVFPEITNKATSLTLDYTEITVESDKWLDLYGVLSPEPDVKTIVATSSNSNIVSVLSSGYNSESGKVYTSLKTHKKGEATITVTATNGTADTNDDVSAQCKVTVTDYTVTVTNDGGGTGTADPAAAPAGTQITLTATPNEGCTFKEWQVMDDANITITDNKFTMPAKNVTVKALFNKDIASFCTVDDISAQTYTGSAITPEPVVKDGDTTLKKGTDYNVEYSNNINAGTATVTVKGTGTYIGTLTKNFTIAPAPVTLTANSDTKTYTGEEQSITGFTCSVSGLTFTNVSAIAKGTNVGDYETSFTGVTLNSTKDTTGNYVISELTNGKLRINNASITPTVRLSEYEFTYNGSEQKPNVTVKVGDSIIPSGEYTVNYPDDCTNVGTKYITVSDKQTGNYSFKTCPTEAFYIYKAPVTVTANNTEKKFGAADPVFTAKVEGLIGNDTVAYSVNCTHNNTAGTYDIIPTGNAVQGNYTVTFVKGTLTITDPLDLNSDGKVDDEDVKQYAAAFLSGDTSGLPDLDGDNAITGKDLIKLRKNIENSKTEP